MHSLEPEYRELHAEGVIDKEETSMRVAVQRGAVFSVFPELRFSLYASVAAITGGLGIVLKENLDRIGPVTVVAGLAALAAACYAIAIRTLRRGESRSIGGDYLLLLGALILSADLGYAEYVFHWLAADWSWHFLILTLLHGVTAYVFKSRLVLAASLSSLAAWFGVAANVGGVFHWDAALFDLGVRGLALAGVLLIWRGIHRRLHAEITFEFVIDNFAANAGFAGALALTFNHGTRFLGIAGLLAMAAASTWRGLRTSQEIFAVYGVCYGTIGLCYIEAEMFMLNVLLVTFGMMIELATVVAGAMLLWRFHQRINEEES